MRLVRVDLGWIRVAAVCAGLLLGVGYAAVRSSASAAPQNTGQTSDGRDVFRTYCASCHGAAGTGNGPAASSMRRMPPDVTGLALANGGVFPAERVRRIIDGREVEAHGDREMPVWGDAFKAAPGGHSDEFVRARIASILQYLTSIQRRTA